MGPHSCPCLPCLLWGLEGHLGPPEGRNRVGQQGPPIAVSPHWPFPPAWLPGTQPHLPTPAGRERVSEGKTAGGARGTHRGPRKSYARGAQGGLGAQAPLTPQAQQSQGLPSTDKVGVSEPLPLCPPTPSSPSEGRSSPSALWAL